MFKLLASGLFFLTFSQAIFAHLMVPQNGTLNIKDGFGFLALSIPANSLKDVDDDMNGKLSIAELTKYRSLIVNQIDKEIYLKYNSITLLKEVAYLELNSSDPAHYLDADQLLVLIKFTIIGSSEINSVNLSSLNLTINLFGTSDDEKKFHITVLNSNAKSEINLYQEHPSVNLQ